MPIKTIFFIIIFSLLTLCGNAQQVMLFNTRIKSPNQELAKYLTNIKHETPEFLNELEKYRLQATKQEATQEDKINFGAILLLDILFNRAEEYEKLEPLLKEASETLHEDPVIEETWGDIFYSKKDYENSVYHYEIALEKAGENLNLLCKYTIAKFNIQNYESALENSLKYLEKVQTNGFMYYLTGRCHFELKQYEEAIDCYEKAKELTQDPAMLRTLEDFIRQAKEFLASTSDSETDEDQRFIITFAGNSREDLGDITFDILDEIYYDVTNLIGINPEVKINIIFFLTEDYYKQGQSWSAGAAQGLQILVPLKSGYKSPEYVKGLLGHEFTHTMVNLKTNNRAPLWVHEGLAQYIEYSITNGSPDQIRNDFEGCLQNDFIEGDLSIPLDKVPAYIGSQDRKNVVRGYVASYMGIRCLVDFYGEQSIDKLLGALGQGKNIAEAIEETTSKDYSDFQSELKDYIKNQ